MRSSQKSNRTSRASQSSSDMPGRRVPRNRKARSFAIYGRSGTGKTTLSSTFPTPILHLDMKDEGTDSIADVEDIELREIGSFAEAEDMYWWLTKHPDEFKTVTLDTTTALNAMLVEEVGGEKARRKGKQSGDWGTMSRQDWGRVSAQMKELITNYRDLTHLGINVVFIAQDRTFNVDDEEGALEGQLAPEVGPALPASVAKHLNASVSVIAHTFIRTATVTKEVRGKKIKKEKTEYCLGLGPHPVYTRKVRKPKSAEVPDYIVDPTYEDIIAIVKGE